MKTPKRNDGSFKIVLFTCLWPWVLHGAALAVQACCWGGLSCGAQARWLWPTAVIPAYGLFLDQDRTQVCCTGRRTLYQWAPGKPEGSSRRTTCLWTSGIVDQGPSCRTASRLSFPCRDPLFPSVSVSSAWRDQVPLTGRLRQQASASPASGGWTSEPRLPVRSGSGEGFPRLGCGGRRLPVTSAGLP